MRGRKGGGIGKIRSFVFVFIFLLHVGIFQWRMEGKAFSADLGRCTAYLTAFAIVTKNILSFKFRS